MALRIPRAPTSNTSSQVTVAQGVAVHNGARAIQMQVRPALKLRRTFSLRAGTERSHNTPSLPVAIPAKPPQNASHASAEEPANGKLRRLTLPAAKLPSGKPTVPGPKPALKLSDVRSSRCSICRHNNRREIDLELIAGTPARSVAERYLLSKSAVHRHYDHVPKNLIQAKSAQDIADAEYLTAEIVRMQQEAKQVYREARQQRSAKIALNALRLALRTTESLTKLVPMTKVEIQPPQQQSLEIPALLAAILRALPDNPDARAKVAEALSPSKPAA